MTGSFSAAFFAGRSLPINVITILIAMRTAADDAGSETSGLTWNFRG